MEYMLPEQAQIGVSLVIPITVWALECVWTQLAFFCLEMRRIDLFVHFTIPCKLAVVLSFVRTITLDTFGSLDMAWQYCMSPLPVVLVLRNTRIHVGSSNCCDVPSYIEAPVNKTLCLTATLNVPNVNPDNRHIRFRWNLDDLWFWYNVRRGSHRGGSLQNVLGGERTCGTTLASAYVLRCLSATWLQLQMIGRSLRWKWVLNGVSPLNTGDRVQ